MDLDETWNISEGPWWALTQNNWEKSPQGFCLRVPKCALFFSVTQPMWPFGHLSCTDFDHFWNKDMNQCAHVYLWKISKFLHRVFSRPQKQLKTSNFEGDLWQYYSNSTILGEGNHIWASRHPKDVPFVRELWWGRTVWALWAPQKNPILAIGAVFLLLAKRRAVKTTESSLFKCRLMKCWATTSFLAAFGFRLGLKCSIYLLIQFFNNVTTATQTIANWSCPRKKITYYLSTVTN